jgi:hypothetical protein
MVKRPQRELGERSPVTAPHLIGRHSASAFGYNVGMLEKPRSADPLMPVTRLSKHISCGKRRSP